MRIALHTRVRADRIEEYERAHAAVPAELTDAIRAAGVTGWTIWRSGTDLFHVIDCADYPAMLAAWRRTRSTSPGRPGWRNCSTRRTTTRRPAATPCCRSSGSYDRHRRAPSRLGPRGQGPGLDHGPGMAPIRRTFTVDDLRPAARAAGVDATVLVQTVTVAAETPEMLALAAADPLVAGVVGWTDLTSPADRRRAGQARRRPGRRLPRRHQAPGAVGAGPGLAAPPRRHPRPARGRRGRPRATTSWCCRTSCPPPATPRRRCPALRWSSTTRASRRSRAATSARGPRRSGSSRRCRTRRASCPGW